MVEARVLEHDRTGEGDPLIVLPPGGLTGWQSWLLLVGHLRSEEQLAEIEPNRVGIGDRDDPEAITAAPIGEATRLLRHLSSRPCSRVGCSELP
jgi:hypothetical protein